MSTDQINHIRYRNEVFIPYAQRTRGKYVQREGWVDGDAIDDECLWVGW